MIMLSKDSRRAYQAGITAFVLIICVASGLGGWTIPIVIGTWFLAKREQKL